MEPFQQLEHDWALVNNLDPEGMVACSSGTAALHLALECLELEASSHRALSQVLVPDFTMVACARAVTLAGLSPSFVDCEEDLLTAPGSFARSCNLATRVLMPVHVYGRQCDMDGIAQIASDLGLYVVEDLAEAHGVKPHPNSTAAAWSFYRNKIISGEEGGAVYFKNPKRAALARQLRSLGFTDAHDFQHVPRGHNYRMSNSHTSLILDSLKDFERIQDRRRGVEAVYNALVPKEWQMPERDAVWVYDVRIPSANLVDVVKKLNAEGIAARQAFKPMRSQEEYLKSGYYNSTAHRMSREVMYLPVNHNMTEAVVARIVKSLIDAVGQ